MAVAPQAAAELESLLGARVDEALERSRRLGRPVLAAATINLDSDLDVAACVFASRRAEERYFVWEQPDRDRFALGGLGAAVTVNAGGSDRFGDAAAGCAETLRDAVLGDEPGAVGEGPLWLGGFAFAPDGGRTPEWRGLPAALLVLPELSLARSGDRVTATANVVCNPGSDAERLVCCRGLAHQRAPLRADAAARPRPGRRLRDHQRAAARAATSGRSPRPATGSWPASWRRSCWRARCESRPAPASNRRPSSTGCAPAIRVVTATASARPRPPSSARAPSCWCAARAHV